MRMIFCILSLFLAPCIAIGGAPVESHNVSKWVQVRPTIQSGIAYTLGDQLGAKFKIAGILDNDARTGIFQSVSYIDLDAQNATIQIFYFSQEPMTVAGDNNVFSISDADMVYCLGAATAGTAFSSAGSSSATSADVQFKGWKSTAKDPTGKATGDIWGVAKITVGNPTYTATNSILLNYLVQ